MVLVLDAGAWLAIERRDENINAALRRSKRTITSAAVVAQVWRGGGRQARLARALGGVDVVPLDDVMGRRIGELLTTTRTRDVVDAHLALLVRDGDVVLTSDPADLRLLLDAQGIQAAIGRI